MFDKYYKNYWEMLSKVVPIPKKFFLDVDWRTKKSAGEQKVGKIWKKYLANVNTILDFGGGSRLTGAMLKNLKWNGIYEIVDSSINVQPEYVKLDDVNKKFDMVVCLQVIEHLYFEDFLDLLPQLSFKLKPGGTLVIGSDHPANSGHLWNVEMGHVKAYPYHNLHQYLQTSGYKYENSTIILQYMDDQKLSKYLIYLFRKYFYKLLGLSPYMSYVIFITKED